MFAPTTSPSTTPCPCGSSACYAECCRRWHDGEAAPTAQALMRSRYSAFVLQRADHLLASWHATRRPPAIDFEPGVQWLGLDVRAHHTDGDRATVEFVARSKLGGRATRLHERSRFVREHGRWFYVDGDLLQPQRKP